MGYFQNQVWVYISAFSLFVLGTTRLSAQDEQVKLSPALQQLALKEKPRSFEQKYVFDPKTELYIYTVKVGEIDVNMPLTLTAEQYSALVLEEKMREYIYDKQKALQSEDVEDQKDLLPDFYVRSKLFESIFGGQTIDITPQGSVGIDLGIRYQKSGNPSISPRNQSSLGFDFDQRISLGLTGNIGTRLRINANYDTQSTFDFQNLIKLEFFPPSIDQVGVPAIGAAQRGIDKIKSLKDGYSGNEDGIIQKLEIGNVSMPLNSSLIQGAQSLFGVKADLKFGNTDITAVISEQRSQSQTVMTSGNGILEEFSLFALDYEEDRHFFLAQYFRDQYDEAVKTYPYINSPIQITRVEVWVTNRSSQTNNVRNLIALQDLGEASYENIGLVNPPISFITTSNPDAYPDNNVNQFDPESIDSGLLNSSIRDIATAKNGFGSLSTTVREGLDYAVLESARKLQPSEYKLQPQLGFISLDQKLSNDEVLAVAYQFTVKGKTYQVGEFAGDGVQATTLTQQGSALPPQVSNNSLMVKLLKSNFTDVNQPVWDLMMKNIYNIGAYRLEKEGFVFNMLYSDPSPVNYISSVDESIWPQGLDQEVLLGLFGLDKLNVYNDLQNGGDGFFDFVHGITVEPEFGRIIFPSVEPFGAFIFELLKSGTSEDYESRLTYNDNQDKYVFAEMYRFTKREAEDYAAFNKFQLKGRYKSSGGDNGISLGAFNVPRGSVRVTAGGRLLQEGIDYTVNYQLGRVTILDEGLRNSNIPIEVSTENNSFFGQQNKRFTAVNIEHKFSDNFIMGATVMNLSERPLTQKANYGLEPVNNTMFGINGNFSKEIPFLTRMVNKLPNIDTEVASKVSFRGEAAYLLSSTPKGTELEGSATSYVDDFEGAQSNIDMRDVLSWKLSSVPAANVLGSDAAVDDLSSGYHRAKLAWYTIDPIFYSSRRPGEINDNDLSLNETRRIFIDEIFPQQDIVQGQSTVQYTFDLAYYPEEKGPYNNNTTTNFGSDLKQNWAGITRPMNSTNFDQANVEYIEFWLLDTFSNADLSDSDLGDLIFNLGNISEDVLKDGRKQYENGLPGPNDIPLIHQTNWGQTPATQSLVYAFDDNQDNRDAQDVGYDGLDDVSEVEIYTNGPQNDPAGDNYQYFLQAGGGILNRYKNYNGVEGNSIIEVSDNNRGSYTQPDSEDLNRDNTMNTIDSYFEYRIPIRKNMSVGAHPFLVDVRENNNVELANGEVTQSRWLQFKVPINPLYYQNPSFNPLFEAVNGISDLRTIRFMRIMVHDFAKPVVFRFGTLDLVRGDWTRYSIPLNEDNIDYPMTTVETGSVNILENENRIPINYILPPGIEREQLNNYNNLIRENEQSLSLQVLNLEPEDSKGVYKNIDIDMRQYKRLKMFIHAESITNEIPLPGEGATEEFDKRMVGFIRIGTDLSENYYQIEVPLKPTSYTEGVSNRLSANEVWQPDSNSIDIPLEWLTTIKAKSITNRNLQGATYYNEDLELIDEFTPISSLPGDHKYKIAIKGNPTLGQIRTIMVGVKNPSTSTGEKLSGEVWFNELRLSEIDSRGGWAAIASMDANLADFATINFNGNISTVGFGNIDQTPNQRSQEDVRAYGFTTNVNVGQLLPQKWRIQLPVNYSISEEFITPEYDPFYQDLKLQNRLDNAERITQRDSIRDQAITYTKIKSINLIGVRKQRSPNQKKNFFDVENLDFSYSFNEEKRHDYEIEDFTFQNVKTGAGYQYSFEPFMLEPFKKWEFLTGKKYLDWLRSINLNPIPNNISLGANINRSFNSQRFREVYLEGIDTGNQLALPELQQRNYLFDWIFTMNHSLTNSLRFDFSASSNNIIRNYIDEDASGNTNINTQLDIWDGFWSTGEQNRYNQSFGLTYEIPFRFVPFIDFINGTYNYTGDFNWQRGSSALSEVTDENGDSLGVVNTIQNANTHTLNGTINFKSLYKDLKLKKNTKASDKKKTKVRLMNSLIGILTALDRFQINYSENNGTVLPGYTQNVGFFGTANPGLAFALGSQQDLRFEAAKKGWLTEFSNFNQQYTQVHNTKWSYSADIDLLEGLQLELTGSRMFSQNTAENFEVSQGIYIPMSPVEYGNFEISTVLLKTSFDKTGEQGQTFNDLRDNRIIIAQRLARERGIPSTDVDADGFPRGYGKSNQAVLIPAFLSAYSGADPDKVNLSATRKTPLPNWSLQYTGLMKLKFFKKNFKRFSITHGYRASHTINAFNTNLDYNAEIPDLVDISGNFLNEITYTNINLVEQFNPLVKIDFELKNSLQFSTEIKKDRALSLSLDNNLLTETTGDEFSLGLGYRIKSVPFTTNFGGKRTTLKGDINLKADLSVRDNITIVRYLDLLNNQVTAGQRLWSLKVSADYALTRNLTALFFYDHAFSKFAISTAFPQTNIRSGITLRYNFGN